jgi:hypothetical protein
MRLKSITKPLDEHPVAFRVDLNLWLIGGLGQEPKNLSLVLRPGAHWSKHTARTRELWQKRAAPVITDGDFDRVRRAFANLTFVQ